MKALDRLRKLLPDISDGPWKAVPSKEAGQGWPLAFSLGTSDRANTQIAIAVVGRHASEMVFGDVLDDAEFICVSRNSMPALLAVAEAAEKVECTKPTRVSSPMEDRWVPCGTCPACLVQAALARLGDP